MPGYHQAWHPQHKGDGRDIQGHRNVHSLGLTFPRFMPDTATWKPSLPPPNDLYGQILDALGFSSAHAGTLTGICFCPLHPGQQSGRHTANLGDYSTERPTGKDIHRDVLLPGEPRSRTSDEKLFGLNSWPHSLKGWNLHQTRGGSRVCTVKDIDGFEYAGGHIT